MSEALLKSPGDVVRDCLEHVARRHRLTVEAIKTAGPNPSRACGHARQEACWMLRAIKRADGRPRFSYPHIARIVGLKDHTSALFGARRHAKRLAEAGEDIAA